MITKASKENNYHYNKNLQSFARHNKKTLTKSATCLWKYALKGKQMQDFKFRRERPILNYIADFACLELMLVIEVDGITHQNVEQQEKDKIRDRALNDIGFTVLRFSSWEVLYNIAQVKYEIKQWIEQNQSCVKQSFQRLEQQE